MFSSSCLCRMSTLRIQSLMPSKSLFQIQMHNPYRFQKMVLRSQDWILTVKSETLSLYEPAQVRVSLLCEVLSSKSGHISHIRGRISLNSNIKKIAALALIMGH